MKIITIPDQTLRQQAKKIEQVDKKLLKFLKNLEETLSAKKDPQGVGLAAPQVGKNLAIFATQLIDPATKSYLPLRTFINPKITAHSQNQSFGADEKNPDLEGCLSIPYLYGPIPRWEWVDLAYQVVDNNQLIDQQERFDNFNARIIQHERDHLDGILFTDYSKKYNLPLYKDVNGKLEEITDLSILETF